MTDVLYLFTTTYTRNAYGVDVPTNVRNEVFCEVHSITRAEFFEAGRNGLNPSFRFTVFAGDYNGETVCEYDGNTYSIYRTYIVGDYIELYVERKGGTNGEQSNP